jgi:hypothetical protein
MLAPLIPLFTCPPVTFEEEMLIVTALEQLADPEPEPLEVPLPASVYETPEEATEEAAELDGVIAEGEAEPEAKPPVVNRKALALLRDELQREAVELHLPIRFYIREASSKSEKTPDPDPKKKGKLIEKTIPVPAALIAARVVISPPKG